MSTTVMDALENAQLNLQNLARMGLGANPIFHIAKMQLDNAIRALDNGKSLDDVIQEDMNSEVDVGD